MRHRSISHILASITVGLTLFILYHAWLKPAWSPPPPPLAASDEQTSAAPIIEPAHLPDPILLPELQQSRLITPPRIADAQLQLIGDHLERGQLRETERLLRRLPNKTLKTARHRAYTAAIWNNLGVQQEKYGGADLSVTAFRQAAEMDATNATILLNLTQAYWARRDPAMTQDFLLHVIELAPADPFPRLALAELLIEKGELDAASHQLEETATAARRQPDLEAYSQRLQARLAQMPPASAPIQVATRRPQGESTAQETAAAPTGRGRKASIIPVRQNPAAAPGAPAIANVAPRQFQERTTERFVIRFEGPDDQDTWIRLRAILEYAHQDIARKFGYAPTTPITVVLHTDRQFDDSAATPAGADTLFDETGGTIHVPGRNALDDLALLSRVVRHQFVHAALHRKLGAHRETVPHWLVEGLALLLAEDPWPGVEDAKAGGPLIPLRTLQDGWTRLAGEQRALAYLEALSATQHLVDRYTMYEVRQLLNLMQAGQTIEAALLKKLSISYDTFERQWSADAAPLLKSGQS
jgi:hypothetical protein